MAIAFSQATTAINNTGSSTSHTYSGNGLASVSAVANGIAFVWFDCGGGSDPTSVTWGGAAMTKLVGGVTPPGRGAGSLWYKLAPATGAVSIVDNFSVADAPNVIWGIWQGVRQTAPEAFASNTTTATSITTSVTTLSAGAWLIGAATNGSGTASAGTGTTGRFLGVPSIGDSNGPVSVGSNSLQFTVGASTGWGMVVASIAPAGGSGFFPFM